MITGSIGADRVPVKMPEEPCGRRTGAFAADALI
jgi:hypothetical protein